MKIKILILLLLLSLLITGNKAEGRNRQGIMDLEVDIAPNVILEVLNDVEIEVDKPRQNGEIMEVNSRMYLETNTDVNLSWESTELRHQENDQILPLGIPDKQLKKSKTGKRVETFTEQPFGLTVSLIREKNTTTDRAGNKEDIYLSSITEQGKRLRSEKNYKFVPGNYNLNILIQYFWSEDANWSEILAGKYTGQIIYTVSAIEE